jgi:hypothetical protein
MKAIILLGINRGYGNSDCGRLPLKAVDLKTGFITYPRPKTGIDRPNRVTYLRFSGNGTHNPEPDSARSVCWRKPIPHGRT